MPLIDPDMPETSMDYLDEASAYFLRAIKQHYTRDTAVDVMEALTPILGKDWKGRLIFGIMANKYSSIRSIRIVKNVKDDVVKKINAIKEVRHISGMGLTEAKALVEAAYYTPKDVLVKSIPQDQFSQAEWDRATQASINVLRDAGFKVEFA